MSRKNKNKANFVNLRKKIKTPKQTFETTKEKMKYLVQQMKWT